MRKIKKAVILLYCVLSLFTMPMMLYTVCTYAKYGDFAPIFIVCEGLNLLFFYFTLRFLKKMITCKTKALCPIVSYNAVPHRRGGIHYAVFARTPNRGPIYCCHVNTISEAEELIGKEIEIYYNSKKKSQYYCSYDRQFLFHYSIVASIILILLYFCVFLF